MQLDPAIVNDTVERDKSGLVLFDDENFEQDDFAQSEHSLILLNDGFKRSESIKGKEKLTFDKIKAENKKVNIQPAQD